MKIAWQRLVSMQAGSVCLIVLHSVGPDICRPHEEMQSWIKWCCQWVYPHDLPWSWHAGLEVFDSNCLHWLCHCAIWGPGAVSVVVPVAQFERIHQLVRHLKLSSKVVCSGSLPAWPDSCTSVSASLIAASPAQPRSRICHSRSTKCFRLQYMPLLNKQYTCK